jgi:hypothetical protein
MRTIFKHPIGIVLPIFIVLFFLLLLATGVLDVLQIGTVMLFFAAGAMTLFCVFYAVVAPWQKSRDGRTIMLLIASVALALDYFSLITFVGHDFEVKYTIRFIIYSLLFIAGWLELGLLIQRQREGRTLRAARLPRLPL